MKDIEFIDLKLEDRPRELKTLAHLGPFWLCFLNFVFKNCFQNRAKYHLKFFLKKIKVFDKMFLKKVF